MRHLYREKNGRYYVRIQFPKAFQRSHPHLVPKSAEIRLSLYSTNHVHARELAHAYWLASRKLVHSDLQALGILTIEDFKSHLRRSVTTHLPQKFTPLIELIGSTEAAKLVIAVKTLSAFNARFFVLPPPSIKGTISRKVITSSRGAWDWIKLATVNEQQLPHMRLPAHVLQDAITAGQDWIEPEHLLNSVNDEKQMLSLAVKWRVGLHQLFISADLPQHIYTVVRKLTDTPPVSPTTVTDVSATTSPRLE
nr:hypothetical protein [uncultured Steroidobacter sp.]